MFTKFGVENTDEEMEQGRIFWFMDAEILYNRMENLELQMAAHDTEFVYEIRTKNSVRLN